MEPTERKELQQKVMDLSRRIRTSNEAIVSMGRSLVPVLNDAGRQHSARELERLLFEFDAAMQEALQLTTDNLDPLFTMLLEGMGGQDMPRRHR